MSYTASICDTCTGRQFGKLMCCKISDVHWDMWLLITSPYSGLD